MNDEQGSPFWAGPPYILLTDVLQLDKVKPWNVDVGKLVAGFLREMKRMGDIDFRISGNALYSASVIFMKKTRELVELGLLPPDEDVDDEEIEIPLIRPPFRVTNQRVTLQELLIAMDRVLSKGVRKRSPPTKRKLRGRADPLAFKMDVTRANVEENIAQVYGDLSQILEIDEVAKFVDILVNNSRIEIVRVFFALLHLFARSYIDIWMDENEEIWVQLLSPPSEEEQEEAIEQQASLR
jgi:segregation and condensation protein A